MTMSNLAYDAPVDGGDSSQSDIAAMQALRPVPRISIQAFCETEGVAHPVERAGEDRRMAKAHLKVHMGGIATAIEFYQSAPTPNLILLESRSEPKQLLEQLAQLSEYCDPSSKVVVIGHYNDVGLYRELIRFGISEYVIAPVSMADVVSVVSSIFVDPEAEPIGRSIAFIGAKGGVGSSTIAHNVAWAMSSLFKSEVVVADLDLAFGTANINFDQDPAQGIAEAVFSPERVDEVYLDRLLAQCAEHLSLLAAPSTLERVYDFDPEAFTQLIDTAQRSVPLLVLDVPHVWTGWTKNTLIKADEIVITATPELANLRNTKNLVDMLSRLRPNDPPPKLIINQAGVPKRPEISASDFAEPLGITPMSVIAFDPLLFGNAANNGRMLGEMDAKSAVVGMINEIAHVLTGRSEIKVKKKAGLGGLLGKLSRNKK
ncbi:AAA family ATPase [Mesorhizobium sp. CCANP35]|uniref:AAA family ATPase n=2 Tax=Mesorhizobium neociceri TaxID=1307853 RepID=A0A838B122_9HYPH|nr:CpaE family protein [Mesorhizobium neociceri]MBA1139589.1 AAA family ATPase [Mesorhizobium neociceri]